MNVDLTIPGKGEDWLEWFLTTDIENRSGINYSEMGRLKRGFLSKTCGSCHGSGLDVTNKISDRKLECLTCYGSGSVVDCPTPPDTKTMWKPCEHCDGIVGADLDCPECFSSGVVDNLTATVTAECDKQSSFEMDEETIARYALISRRFSRLSREAKLVLSAFYGYPGLRWGRQFSLLGFTESGGKLLELVRTEMAKRGVTDMARILDAMGNEVSERRPELENLIGIAEREADALYVRVCREWRSLR